MASIGWLSTGLNHTFLAKSALKLYLHQKKMFQWTLCQKMKAFLPELPEIWPKECRDCYELLVSPPPPLNCFLCQLFQILASRDISTETTKLVVKLPVNHSFCYKVFNPHYIITGKQYQQSWDSLKPQLMEYWAMKILKFPSIFARFAIPPTKWPTSTRRRWTIKNSF